MQELVAVPAERLAVVRIIDEIRILALWLDVVYRQVFDVELLPAAGADVAVSLEDLASECSLQCARIFRLEGCYGEVNTEAAEL